jgi:anti-sigma factor RsiW
MKHERIIRRYQGWVEGGLGAEERREIERHIGECDDCRAYYDKMTRLLDQMNPALLPLLTPDPAVPARIRAMAASGKTQAAETGDRRTRSGNRRFAWARVSLAGAALAAAVIAGVLLGRGLATNTRYPQETDLATAYYEAFSPTDIAGGWADVMSETDASGQKEGNR